MSPAAATDPPSARTSKRGASPERGGPSLGMVLVALGIVLIGISLVSRFVRRGSSSPLAGKPAPEVTFLVAANRDGAKHLGIGELRGQPLLLDFWASWCGPCAAQAPILERVHRRFSKDGLVVLGVNVDDPPEVAKAYAQRKKLSYPMVVDESDEASKLYDVKSLPSLVLIDREGKVRAYWAGIVDEARLEEAVAEVM